MGLFSKKKREETGQIFETNAEAEERFEEYYDDLEEGNIDPKTPFLVTEENSETYTPEFDEFGDPILTTEEQQWYDPETGLIIRPADNATYEATPWSKGKDGVYNGPI